MKRWNISQMLETGKKLFTKIHRQKFNTHHNHEIHYMAREINGWLPKGVQSMVDGAYNPRCLKRYYFSDEMVEQLGRIKEVLEKEKPNYIIRADIKSFYKSIPHHKLIQDIKKLYHDPKLLAMLVNIITNPIDTLRGCKNPSHGVALRGPLSKFFSGIYLKPLDDAFNNMTATYLRYQDDIIILCKTKRQLNRCKTRMMDVLHERHLRLSRKKSRIGDIQQGFHFLGFNYSPTQIENSKHVTYVNDDVMIQLAMVS